MLASRINFEEAIVLDLCCGTGNISFEFASRGAKSILAIDAHFGCTRYVHETAKQLGFTGLKAYKSDIFKYLEKEENKYNLIFVDPPYEADWIEKISEAIFSKNILLPEGILVIEHGSKTNLSAQPHFIEKRNYGNVNFSIFIHP